MNKLIAIIVAAFLFGKPPARKISPEGNSSSVCSIGTISDQASFKALTADIGNDSDYIFSPPTGWTRSTLNGMSVFQSPLLECTSYSYYTLYCMHSQRDTSNLLDFVKKLHALFYAGKRNDPYIHYEPNNEYITRGTTDQGLEYISYCTDAQKIINEATPDRDIFWQYYMVYVIRNGKTIYPFLLMQKPYNYRVGGRASTVNGFTWSCKALDNAWRKMETSIKVLNPNTNISINKESITGVWSGSVHVGWSSIAGGQYAMENTQLVNQFQINDNGTFVRKKANSKESNGVYSLNRNEITFKESTGKTYTCVLKLQSVFEFGRWKRRMYLTEKDGNTMELAEKM